MSCIRILASIVVITADYDKYFHYIPRDVQYACRHVGTPYRKHDTHLACDITFPVYDEIYRVQTER